MAEKPYECNEYWKAPCNIRKFTMDVMNVMNDGKPFVKNSES